MGYPRGDDDERLVVDFEDDPDDGSQGSGRIEIEPDPEPPTPARGNPVPRPAVSPPPPGPRFRAPPTRQVEYDHDESWDDDELPGEVTNEIPAVPDSSVLPIIPRHLKGQVAMAAVAALLGLISISCLTAYMVASSTDILPTGETGARGHQGPEGEKGGPGPKGEVGPVGDRGSQGSQGPPGAEGPPGYFDTPTGPIPSV